MAQRSGDSVIDFVARPRRKGAGVASARRALDTEAAGLEALKRSLENGLSEPFEQAVEKIGQCAGRVVVTGLGKSGHIGKKIAATLASTGTPAFFVHPSEASHGDLGMITANDVVLALSWSGETAELQGILAYLRRFQIALISMTATSDSFLARQSDIVLALPQVTEACPHGLAPTTSTLLQLALGDALAIALLEGRGFTADHFHAFHPGGKLGANLKLVRDVMHQGPTLPLVEQETPVSDAILAISEKGFGCVGITDSDGRLVGIITDGDLRRHMSPDLLRLQAVEIMTPSPKSVAPGAMVGEALALMNLTDRPFTAVFVVERERPVGILHMHDLLRVGVV